MAGWPNFHIWRGKLPHWRADSVTYYVTFKHRRDLLPDECQKLFRNLLKPDGKKWEIQILCVMPNQTELLFKMEDGKEGRPFELSEVVESAKKRAGKEILKKTEEKYSPFYQESYDRIIRDDAELESFFETILSSPVDAELADEPEEYPYLWVPNAPHVV